MSTNKCPLDQTVQTPTRLKQVGSAEPPPITEHEEPPQPYPIHQRWWAMSSDSERAAAGRQRCCEAKPVRAEHLQHSSF